MRALFVAAAVAVVVAAAVAEVDPYQVRPSLIVGPAEDLWPREEHPILAAEARHLPSAFRLQPVPLAYPIHLAEVESDLAGATAASHWGAVAGLFVLDAFLAEATAGFACPILEMPAADHHAAETLGRDPQYGRL